MLFSYRSDEVVMSGVTMSNEDPDYPATNVIDDSPVTGGISRPAKSLGNSTIFTLVPTVTTPRPDALFLFNLSDTAGVQCYFTPDGYSPIPVPLPLRDLDGHGNNAWLDLRGYASPMGSGAQWTVEFIGSTAATMQVGRIFLTATLRELHVVVPTKFVVRRPDVDLFTIGGKAFITDKGIRNRAIEFQVLHNTERQKLQSLFYSAQGRNYPWPLVPWDDRNDALWVTFANPELLWQETEGLTIEDSTIQVVQWMGLPL